MNILVLFSKQKDSKTIIVAHLFCLKTALKLYGKVDQTKIFLCFQFSMFILVIKKMTVYNFLYLFCTIPY